MGHYNEPNLTLTVPMDKLKAKGALEFNMVYHVDRQQFEYVEIIDFESKAVLGKAKYEVQASRQVPTGRGGSSDGRAAAANALDLPDFDFNLSNAKKATGAASSLLEESKQTPAQAAAVAAKDFEIVKVQLGDEQALVRSNSR